MCVLSKKDRRTDGGGKGIFALRAFSRAGFIFDAITSLMIDV